jgi:hypothetical protein
MAPAEYGVAVEAYQRFRADLDAFLLLCGLVAIGRR